MGLQHLKAVYIAASTTATAPSGQYFKAFTVLTVTGTIAVKGGIHVALDADDSDGSTHLNASGSGTLTDDHAAGIYEMLPTVALAMTIPAGTTVYGNYSEIACGSGDIVIAYL